MADKKFSAFTEDTAPAITDLVVGLTGGDNKKMSIQNITKKVQLDVTGAYAHAEGQLSYNAYEQAAEVGSGIDGVSELVGRTNNTKVYNDTGVQLDAGEPISATGVITGGFPNAVPTDTLSILSCIAHAGVAAADIPNGEYGLATSYGHVHDVDTSLLTLGFIYADGLGGYTQTRPRYPQNRLSIGGVIKVGALDGILSVTPQLIKRNALSSVFPFTSSGVGSGTHFLAGSYDWSATDANLTQASTSVAYGTSGAATGAHAGVVAGGAGVVDAGVVGLRVTGDSFTDAGVTTIGDTEIISSDITTLSLNEYVETSKNWTGDILFELFVVSGTPVNYSLDINYGFSSYIDAGNTDFTITGLRFEGLCGGTDAGIDLTLQKHSALDWTYAATGFVAGDGDIASMATDMAPNSTIVNAKNFKYKRAGLTEFINGGGSEGFLISVTTTNNNAIQSALATVSGFSEELT